MTKFDFSGKVALVTGASRGIGFAIARGFLEAGAKVMLNGSTQEHLEVALDRLSAFGGLVTAYRADVQLRPEVEAMFAALLARWGRIDVLVNNAGIYPSALAVEMSEELWDRVVDTNLKAAFLTSQLAAREMVAQGQGGKIVNIASGSWKNARVGASAYCASKAGLVMLAACMAQELGKYGITVNCIAPGLTDVSRESSGDWQGYRQRVIDMTPAGRAGKPEDIAYVALMLCSAEAEFVTGTVVSVDGGLSLGRYSLGMRP